MVDQFGFDVEIVEGNDCEEDNYVDKITSFTIFFLRNDSRCFSYFIFLLSGEIGTVEL